MDCQRLHSQKLDIALVNQFNLQIQVQKGMPQFLLIYGILINHGLVQQIHQQSLLLLERLMLQVTITSHCKLQTQMGV